MEADYQLESMELNIEQKYVSGGGCADWATGGRVRWERGMFLILLVDLQYLGASPPPVLQLIR